jgi:hypothetical protein
MLELGSFILKLLCLLVDPKADDVLDAHDDFSIEGILKE